MHIPRDHMESTKEAWCKICAHAKKDCDVVFPKILYHLTNLFATRWLSDDFNVGKMTLIFSIPSSQLFLGFFWLSVNVGLTQCQLQPTETLLLYTYSNMLSCLFSCFGLKVINSGFRPCVKPNCKQIAPVHSYKPIKCTINCKCNTLPKRCSIWGK